MSSKALSDFINGKLLNKARSTASSSTPTRDSARRHRRATPKQSSRRYDMSYHPLDDMLSTKDKSGTPEVNRPRKHHSRAVSQIGSSPSRRSPRSPTSQGKIYNTSYHPMDDEVSSRKHRNTTQMPTTHRAKLRRSFKARHQRSIPSTTNSVIIISDDEDEEDSSKAITAPTPPADKYRRPSSIEVITQDNVQDTQMSDGFPTDVTAPIISVDGQIQSFSANGSVRVHSQDIQMSGDDSPRDITSPTASAEGHILSFNVNGSIQDHVQKNRMSVHNSPRNISMSSPPGDEQIQRSNTNNMNQDNSQDTVLAADHSLKDGSTSTPVADEPIQSSSTTERVTDSAQGIQLAVPVLPSRCDQGSSFHASDTDLPATFDDGSDSLEKGPEADADMRDLPNHDSDGNGHVECLVSLIDVLAQAAPDVSTEVAPDVSPKTALGVLTQAAHGVSARAAHDVVAEAALEISAEGASVVSGEEPLNVSDDAILGDVTINPLKKVADLSQDSSSIALNGTGALCSSMKTCETRKPCSACFKTVLQSEAYMKTRDIFQEYSCDNPKDTQISDDAPIEYATTSITSRDGHTHSYGTDDNNQDNSPTLLPDKRLQPSGTINITQKNSHDAQKSIVFSSDNVSVLNTSEDGHTQITSEDYTVRDDSRTDVAVSTFPANEQLQSPGTFEIFEDKMHADQGPAEVLLTMWDHGNQSHTDVTIQNTETAMNDLQLTHDHSSGSFEKDFSIDLDTPYLLNARWGKTWDVEILASYTALAASSVSGAAAVHVSNEATLSEIMIAPIERSARASSEPALSASCLGTLQSACISSSQSCPANIPLDWNWNDNSSIDLPEIFWKCDTCLEYVLPSEVYTRLTCCHVCCIQCLSQFGASKHCYACRQPEKDVIAESSVWTSLKSDLDSDQTLAGRAPS